MPGRLSDYAIAHRNIRRHPVRSFCLIASQLLFAAFLFTGTVLILGLSGGAVSMSNRLGADIMIVPSGYDPHIDNILLTGKPSAFYLPDGAMSELEALHLDAIDRITPQVFMATLRASCCAYPVQIMGIDYDSDFIVRNWLDASLKRPLDDGEIILGYHSTGNVGDNIVFFGKSLRIAGRLERTGMGFDSSVFMNRNTIVELANAADSIKPQKLAANNNLVSVIMLKLKPSQDPAQTAREINKALNSKGMYALFSKRFVSNISSSLVMVSRVIEAFLIVLWVMAVVIIALLFSLNVSERGKEFGVLRAIGATRKKLALMILTESGTISIFGAIAGIILGGIIILAASPFIAEVLGLPFLLPYAGKLIFTGTCAGIITVITGLLASGIFAIKAGHDEIHDNMR